MGKTKEVEKGLGELDDAVRGTGDIRIVAAALDLAQNHPESAQAEVEPILDGSAPMTWAMWNISALLLDAIARDAQEDVEGALRVGMHAVLLHRSPAPHPDVEMLAAAGVSTITSLRELPDVLSRLKTA